MPSKGVKKKFKDALANIGLTDFLLHLSKNKLRILMYHGVSENELSQDIFEQQLRYIKKRFDCYWVSEVPELLSTKTGRCRPALILTFDDGLKNNLTRVAPLLEKYNIKATFYIVNDFLRGGQMLWFGEMRCLLMIIRNSDLPQEIPLFSEKPKARWSEIKQFVDTVKDWPNDNRQRLLETLRRILPAPSFENWMKEEFEVMSRENVLRLPEMVEIGSHTLTHPILTSITDEQAKNEIQDSKEKIESWLGKRIKTFCYPNGIFSKRDVDLVKESYEAAVCVKEGFAEGPLHTLARIPVAKNMCDFIFRLVRPIS